MIQEKLKQAIKNKYFLITLIVFGVIFVSRVLYLSADLPNTHVEIEEQAGGYNARNMLFLGHFPLFNNWYQPMVYMPVQNMLSYVSFSIFGIGLAQFRAPVVLASFVGIIFFYLILYRQTNKVIALVGTFGYAFNFAITIWNRSGLTENLYLFFIPASAYFLTKKTLKEKDVFYGILLATLVSITKVDGYPFLLAVLVYLLITFFKNHSLLKNIKPVIFGSLIGGLILLVLFFISDSFKYIAPMYQFYFDMFGKQASMLSGMGATFQKASVILLTIDPYIIISFIVLLSIFILKRNNLNQGDKLILLFLFFAMITRLQVSSLIIYWKRLVYLYFPMYYIIFRGIYLLLYSEKLPVEKFSSKKKFFDLLILNFFFVFLIHFLFKHFNKAIPRLFCYDDFAETFHYTKGSFLFLLFIIIAIYSLLNYELLFKKNFKKIILSLIIFFLFTSFFTNLLKVGKMYLPFNIRYSYAANIALLGKLPEKETIIADEQGFRAFAYLAKNDFYFNHDGGDNPTPYREVLERKDMRYFILNIEEFWRASWGIPNKVRLELLKQVYPNLKLVEVFFASGIPLAIYDKYGENP